MNFTKLLYTTLALVFSISLGGPAVSVPQFSQFVHAPRPLDIPDFSFVNHKGESLSLNQFKGKVTLLVFWATWCPNCLPEASELDALARYFKGKNFQLLALSHDKDPAAVENFYRVKNIQHTPIYFDKNGSAASALNIRGVPTAILINQAGQELGRIEGAAPWGGEEARALIQHFLS